MYLREAAKKVFLLMAGSLRGGQGSLRKKLLFFQSSIKLEGEGGLGLNGPAIRRRTFFYAASLTEKIKTVDSRYNS